MLLDTRNALKKGYKNILLQLSCGGGKSVIAAHIAKMATAKGKKVLLIVHRQELCQQLTETFIKCGVDMSLCHIGMVQTISRRINKIPKPDLLIADECHHASSTSYRRVIEWADCSLIGFTATPVRLSKKESLADIFEVIIKGSTVRWLIDNKFLAPEKCYSLNMTDLSELKVKYGEYDIKKMAISFENEQVYTDTVKAYAKYAQGKKAIVYNVSVKAAQETARTFCENGYRAACISADTPKKERAELMERFRNSDIEILCNCELFGEGVDVKDCECVMLLRKTKSHVLYIQMSMRCMRYDPNNPDKQGIILDCAANILEHGLPSEEHEYSLSPAPKSKQKGDAPVKVCPKCDEVLHASARICSCGYQFPQKEGIIADVSDLMHVDEESILWNKHVSYSNTLTTWEEMRQFQQTKGYKFAWAIHRCLDKGIEIPDKYYRHVEFAMAARQEKAV